MQVSHGRSEVCKCSQWGSRCGLLMRVRISDRHKQHRASQPTCRDWLLLAPAATGVADFCWPVQRPTRSAWRKGYIQRAACRHDKFLRASVVATGEDTTKPTVPMRVSRYKLLAGHSCPLAARHHCKAMKAPVVTHRMPAPRTSSTCRPAQLKDMTPTAPTTNLPGHAPHWHVGATLSLE